MVKSFTIDELLQKGIDMLDRGDFSNPLLDVQILLCYVLNVDKIYIYTHRNRLVDSQTVDNFLKLVKKRKEGYPIQYIVKKQEFMGLDFFVDEGVLIPRPDTEVLVESIIGIVNKGHFSKKDVIRIVDIGTGSGAITLSLAYYIENSLVYSVDISDRAIEIATKNCKRLGLENRVKFLQGDLLEPLMGLNLQGNVDIIVSNPPYIPSYDIQSLQREVSIYEPRIALDGGVDGLQYYRRIAYKSIDYLTEDGLLAFEIGYNQGDSVETILEEKGCFNDIQIVKDLSGHDRVVLAFKGGKICSY